MQLTVQEITQATKGRAVKGNPAVSVTGVSIDTRTIKAGEIYIAIKGKKFDGHSFISEAVKAQAVAVMVEPSRELPKELPESLAVIEVIDTRKALLELAEWYRSKLSARIIAVTGSNGKTTTKEMIGEVLKNRFRVLKAPASYNNDIGVPLTVLAMNELTEIGVFEIEMNELGGTRRLTKVCKPVIGIITNVGDTHLEFMKDRTEVAKEKAELIESLPDNGVAILNQDDSMVLAMRPKHCQTLTFGLNSKADIFATALIDRGIGGIEFHFMGKHPVKLLIPGRHNVYNFLAAAATAWHLGLTPEETVNSLLTFSLPSHRLSINKLRGVVLIDDCFNANPQSMTAALEVLKNSASQENRVAILGEMLELGEHSEQLHKELGEMAGRGVDRLVVIGNGGRFIAAGAQSAGLPLEKIRCYPETESVLKDLFDILKYGDTILVKGSRALALEKITEGIVRYYGKETN